MVGDRTSMSAHGMRLRGVENFYPILGKSGVRSRELLTVANVSARMALAEGYDNGLKSHQRSWQNFWSQSRVTIPDADIQRQYDIAHELVFGYIQDNAWPLV